MSRVMPHPARPVAAAPPPPRLRWWGWGDRDAAIAPGLSDVLRADLGIDGRVVTQPVALEDVELPPSRLDENAVAALRAAVAGQLHDDRLQRVVHAAGKSYVDLMRQREGRPLAVPDAVASPGSEAEVVALLAACEEHRVAVVPFGGGTSVVGGVTPLTGEQNAVIALDLGRMSGMVMVDAANFTAVFRPGTRGPDAEAALNDHGFTLGHFPQSFEYATIGGFAAARSAGQASSGYGRFDEMVIGSEGVLGVITEVTVRIHPAPQVQWYEAWSLPGFPSAASLLKRLMRRGLMPDVARVSDSDETRLLLQMSDSSMTPLLQRLLALRGQSAPSLCILGWDGSAEDVSRRRGAALSVLRQYGALRVGRRAGESWRRHRFESPYLRDPLIDRGVLVETLETVALWDRIEPLHREVVASLRTTLRDGGHDPLVGAHISHVYPEGASLYVTVMARAGDDPVDRWLTAKAAVNDILARRGAPVSHHHGVGADHRPWLAAGIGDGGVAALRAEAAVRPRRHHEPGEAHPRVDRASLRAVPRRSGLLSSPRRARTSRRGRGPTSPPPGPAVPRWTRRRDTTTGRSPTPPAARGRAGCGCRPTTPVRRRGSRSRRAAATPPCPWWDRIATRRCRTADP
jgi:alkyldihydroxyacetonephosphate synthase